MCSDTCVSLTQSTTKNLYSSNTRVYTRPIFSNTIDITKIIHDCFTYFFVNVCLKRILSSLFQYFVEQMTDQWSPSSPTPLSPKALTSWLFESGDVNKWLCKKRLVVWCQRRIVLPHLIGFLHFICEEKEWTFQTNKTYRQFKNMKGKESLSATKIPPKRGVNICVFLPSFKSLPSLARDASFPLYHPQAVYIILSTYTSYRLKIH